MSASLSDGSSVSLMEAMASGLPVLVSDIPGNREWVTEENGWLFAVNDVTVIAGGDAAGGGCADGVGCDGHGEPKDGGSKGQLGRKFHASVGSV